MMNKRDQLGKCTRWNMACLVLVLLLSLSFTGCSPSLSDIEEWRKTGDVDPLIGALKNGKWNIRKAAAEALGEIKDLKAVEPLSEALKDENGDVQTAATWALVKIGKPAVESLIETLNGHGDMRGVVAMALGMIGDTRAIKPLGVVLKDENKCVAFAAAMAMGMFRDARAVEPLIAIAVMKDDKGCKKDRDVQAAAVGALVKIGKPAVESLVVALRDKYTRGMAAVVLGMIGDARAIGPLKDLSQYDSNSDVRRAAQMALAKIRGK